MFCQYSYKWNVSFWRRVESDWIVLNTTFLQIQFKNMLSCSLEASLKVLFVFFKNFTNAFLFSLLLLVMRRQVLFLMMFPGIQHINFPCLLTWFFPTKIDPWICLQHLANFCQNHSGQLTEFLIHLYDFPHSIAPE